MDSKNSNRIMLAVRNNYLSWSSVANSYIGSWISLTSNSEIRYEGFLYRFNPQDSTVVLSNVQCFGTEGRKMDGTEIPPIDMVYEYIIFRGTDMKDFQVKSSPPVQPREKNYNNADIIQPRVHSSNFPGSMPLYQLGGNLKSSEASPYAANSTGSTPYELPHLHLKSLLRPPLDLSIPSFVQQAMQYYNCSTLKSVSSNFPKKNVVPMASATLVSNFLPITVINKAPNESTSIVGLPVSLPLLTPLSPTVLGSSGSIGIATPPPGLVTTSHLLHRRPAIVHSPQSSQTPPKDGRLVEVSLTSSLEPSLEVSAETQQLKSPSRIASHPSHRHVDNNDYFSKKLSSIGQDHSSQNEMNIHTEKFGDFTRYHGGRAQGVSHGRGGRGRSYGRGGRYGWYGRGRGRGISHRGGS